MSGAASQARAQARRAARRTGPASTPADVVLGVGYVFVALAIATALAWPIFDTWRLALVAAVGGVLGSGAILLGRALRWPWLTTVLVVAVGYLVVVVPVAVPSGLGSIPQALTAERDGLTGVVLGWKQLLTLSLPLGQYQAVLVPFLVIALIGSAVATALATRASRWAELAVPVVLSWGAFGVAFAATDPGSAVSVAGFTMNAPREVLLGTVLVLASLAWLLLRARLRRRAALAVGTSTTSAVLRRRSAGSLLGRRILAGALVVVALGAGTAAAAVTGGVTLRSTLRTGAAPQLVLNAQSSPLNAYRAAFESSQITKPLFRLSGDLTGIDRVPIAVLSNWDGQQFTVGSDDSAQFTRVPGGTPARGAHKVTVTVQSEAGVWMPMPAGVESAPVFSGPRAQALEDAFYLDRDSGAAIDVVKQGAQLGLASGDSYTVEAPAEASAPLGDPGPSGGLDAHTYPQLTAWVKAQGQPRTAAGLTELVSRLRARGYLSHSVIDDADAASWVAAVKASSSSFTFQSSYAGHSLARIETLFKQLNDHQKRAGAATGSAALVGGVGDDEQFAAAGALLARDLGYDSRVVLGVRTVPLEGSGVPACESECDSADLAAWIQVKSPVASTWTTLDVEPQFQTPPVQVSVGEQFPKNPTIPEHDAATTAKQPDAQPGGNTASARSSAHVRGWLDVLLPILRIVGVVALVVFLLLLPPLVVAIAKAARRRGRREAAVPEVAIVGAWAETADLWADARRPAPGATRTSQAAAVGSPAALRLAELVDRAVFAPQAPPRETAREAWALFDDERRRVTSELGVWQRLRTTLSFRSVLAAFRRGGRTAAVEAGEEQG